MRFDASNLESEKGFWELNDQGGVLMELSLFGDDSEPVSSIFITENELNDLIEFCIRLRRIQALKKLDEIERRLYKVLDQETEESIAKWFQEIRNKQNESRNQT